MKKLILISLILFFTVPTFAGESKLKLSFDSKPKSTRDTPKTYKALQFNFIVLDFTDICSTYYGISFDCKEVNPLVRWYIKNPTLTIYIHAILNFGIIKVSNLLYKKNKKIAWAFMLGISIIKTYIIYRNIKTLSRL